PAGPRGQPVPLHRLPQHREVGPVRRPAQQGRGERSAEPGGERMTAVDARPAISPEIGKDRRRKEDQRLITGRTRWTDNIALPGMLHLAMVRSPFAHAMIRGIDTEAAKAAPNVSAVLTGKDVADEQGV